MIEVKCLCKERELSKCCEAEMQEGNNQCLSCGACGICEGSGFIEKTEWTGTDSSHEILVRCECNQE